MSSIIIDPDASTCTRLLVRRSATWTRPRGPAGVRGLHPQGAALTELFGPTTPSTSTSTSIPPEMAKILSGWKPRFIHSERSTKLVRAIVAEAGFAPAETH